VVVTSTDGSAVMHASSRAKLSRHSLWPKLVYQPRRKYQPHGLEPAALVKASADVDHWTHRLCLGCGEATTKVKRLAGELFPLAQRWVADAVQCSERLGSQPLGLDRLACDAGVPDRPAVSLFQSLIAAVDGQHE
jgi:hypothetical protein